PRAHVPPPPHRSPTRRSSDLLRHGTRTPAVERALTDFGAEESFGQAAKRFLEHYGFEVGRTTVLRVVERHAEAAQKFVHERLEEDRKSTRLNSSHVKISYAVF